MAKKKKEKEVKDLVDEKSKSQDADMEEIDHDAEDDGQKDVGEPEEKSGTPEKSWIRKWWLPALLVFIFVAGIPVAVFRQDLMKIIKGKKAVYVIDLTNDNLQEEGLLPFFIPPPSELSSGAVRVDLSVIWDGLASVRYKTNELRIRDQVYDYLRGVAEETEDLDSQRVTMEQEIGGILRKSLGVKDLAIRIKEIRAI